MTGAEERGDRKAAAEAVHTLKGMSANIGAERVRAAAWRAEKSWREEGSAPVAEILRSELLSFRKVLDEIRERGYGDENR